MSEPQPVSMLLSVLALATSTAAGAQWRPAEGPLQTRWAKDVSPANVHPEYPRPQLRRARWQNLNGLWDYAIRSRAAGPPRDFDGRILVPFPVESSLSGVRRRVGEGQRLWYRRRFDAGDRNAGERLLLHFGAVDFAAEVRVDGTAVGAHRGGYDPFHFDITDALRRDGPHEVVVAVWDPTDRGFQARGKQVARPRGIWYTPVTGIWQTVWLEPVPATAIRQLVLTPVEDGVRLRVEVDGKDDPRLEVAARALAAKRPVATAAGRPGASFLLEIAHARRWSPASPFLYDLEVDLRRAGKIVDSVRSYFGLRTIELRQDAAGVPRLFLNGNPLFQYGTLDQGWWPDGLYTAPTDAALAHDVALTKQLGFNMIRKHVKVEPARFYWHCDRVGMLVWQDMPNGDRHAPFARGRGQAKEIERRPESARQFFRELGALIDTHANHPCIVVWVPFNEGWGQFETARVARWIEQRDPTRLVDCASGWNDFPVGDVVDLHRYPGPAAPAPQPGRARVLGEFGGLGLPVAGHLWQKRENWGYRTYENAGELLRAYGTLVTGLRQLIPRGLAAAVYTQTTDVETEVNGLLTYDRAVLKMPADKLAALNAQVFQPAPRVEPVVATSRESGKLWRYTGSPPGAGWQRPDFDDAAWPLGRGGFGAAGTPGAVVRTEWKSADLWLRRVFDCATLPRNPHLRIHHDEDAAVWLNGVLVAELAGYTTDYALVPFLRADALRKGRNVLAVHCRQTRGGQYIDAGIDDLVESSARRSFTRDGAWCWFADPRAVCHSGKHRRTYAGWVTSKGDIVVGSLDHATQHLVRTVLHPALERDDHASPALLLRPDGRLTAFYTKHAGTALFARTTREPEDVSAWGPERSFAPNSDVSGRNNYCYPNPVQLAAENHRIFLFWRGEHWKPTLAMSEDGGESFSRGRIVLMRKGAGADNRPYLKAASNGHDTIHLSFTDGHPRDEPANSIYYACYRNGAFFRADGTKIARLEELPFEPRQADRVYDGRESGARAWIWDVAADESGRPVIVYARLPAEDDHRYRYARWTGERWQDHEITAAGGWFPITPAGRREREPHYSGGVVLDHADPRVVYLSRPVHGVFEIERWVTADGGRTFASSALTRGSRAHNVRPCVVRGATGGPRVLWMNLHGGYVHYTRFLASIEMGAFQ